MKNASSAGGRPGSAGGTDDRETGGWEGVGGVEVAVLLREDAEGVRKAGMRGLTRLTARLDEASFFGFTDERRERGDCTLVEGLKGL